jgi:hypothetical protein
MRAAGIMKSKKPFGGENSRFSEARRVSGETAAVYSSSIDSSLIQVKHVSSDGVEVRASFEPVTKLHAPHDWRATAFTAVTFL